MSIYSYRGRNADQETVTGTIDADSQSAVMQQLMAGGITVIDIDAAPVEVRKAVGPTWWERFSTKAVTDDDVILFSRQMSTLQRTASAPDSWLTRRAMEWMLVLALVLILMGIFIRQVRVVQAQAEVAAVKSTLGALRMALVLDFVHINTPRGGAAESPKTTLSNSGIVTSAQHNPFLRLAQVPANYLDTGAANYSSDSANTLSTVVTPLGNVKNNESTVLFNLKLP